MTAGHGIAHTEDSLHDGEQLHAAQLWIALPPEHKDCPPAFDHYAELPHWREDSAELTLLAGRYGERTAPAHIHSPLVGIDIACDSTSNITLQLDPGFEYGLMPLVGDAMVDGETISADELAYLGKGRSELQLALPAGARVLFLGGRAVRGASADVVEFCGLQQGRHRAGTDRVGTRSRPIRNDRRRPGAATGCPAPPVAKRRLIALELSCNHEAADLDRHSTSAAAQKLGNARMRLGLNGLNELSTSTPTTLSPSAGDNERGPDKGGMTCRGRRCHPNVSRRPTPCQNTKSARLIARKSHTNPDKRSASPSITHLIRSQTLWRTKTSHSVRSRRFFGTAWT